LPTAKWIWLKPVVGSGRISFRFESTLIPKSIWAWRTRAINPWNEHCGSASPSTQIVERIPPLAPKITVITATNDRALAVAGWLAGGTTRVGAAEKSQLEKLGLRVIDASADGWGLINHDLFLSNAQVQLVIRRAVDGLPLDHS